MEGRRKRKKPELDPTAEAIWRTGDSLRPAKLGRFCLTWPSH